LENKDIKDDNTIEGVKKFIEELREFISGLEINKETKNKYIEKIDNMNLFIVYKDFSEGAVSRENNILRQMIGDK